MDSPEPLLNDLRAAREAAELTQQALADRLGVSRQAVQAIESGRQTPSTHLALRMARALGVPVDHLFRLGGGEEVAARWVGRQPESSTTTAPRVVDSSRAILARVGETLVAHALPLAGVDAADGLAPAPAGDVAQVQPFHELDSLPPTVLIAGCAPALGLLAARVNRYRGVRAHWIPMGSERALSLLEQGLVHVAGIHLTAAHDGAPHANLLARRLPNQAWTLTGLTHWQQGVLLAPGNPLGVCGPEDLARPDLRLALREPGSAARTLLGKLLPEAAGPGAPDAPSSPPPVAFGHEAVAQMVAWRVADAGIATQAAAQAWGLEFDAYVEEPFDLVIPDDYLEDEPVRRLMDELTSAAFRNELSGLPGNDTAGTGRTVAASSGALAP